MGSFHVMFEEFNMKVFSSYSVKEGLLVFFPRMKKKWPWQTWQRRSLA